MSAIRLRPMTGDEYHLWRVVSDEEYAREKGRAAGWPVEEALARSTAEHDALLPDGLATAGMHLLVAEDEDGTKVGTVFLRDHHGWVYLYDIAVVEHRRGQGLGRAAMQAVAAYARDLGAAYVELNVWDHNTVARSLYRSLGYVAADEHLRLQLT